MVEMDFTKVIYEVIKIDSFRGLIRVKGENGKKSEIRVPIQDNKRLLTEIKKGDRLEIEVKGWQVRSIRRISIGSNMGKEYESFG
jgi:hypothetical protein